jgi:hypothetical protein
MIYIFTGGSIYNLKNIILIIIFLAYTFYQFSLVKYPNSTGSKYILEKRNNIDLITKIVMENIE